MKTMNEFEKIWADVVKPLIVDFKEVYHLKTRYSLRLLQQMTRRNYQKYSSQFFELYMAETVEKIDRHKIAACFLKSILLVRPISIPLTQKIRLFFRLEKMEEDIQIINQYLALSVAITILDGYIQADSNKKLTHKIYLPEPFPNEDSDYLRDMCIDLYYTSPKNINILTYANVFFLLEKYSCRKVQSENFKNKCIELLEKEKLYTEQEICAIIDSVRNKAD